MQFVLKCNSPNLKNEKMRNDGRWDSRVEPSPKRSNGHPERSPQRSENTLGLKGPRSWHRILLSLLLGLWRGFARPEVRWDLRRDESRETHFGS